MSNPALRSLLGYRGMSPLQDLPISLTAQVNVLTVASEAPSPLAPATSPAAPLSCQARPISGTGTCCPFFLELSPQVPLSLALTRPSGLCPVRLLPSTIHSLLPLLRFTSLLTYIFICFIYLLLFSLFQNEHSMRTGALLLFLDISLKPRLKPGRYLEFNKHPWKEFIVWPDTFLLSSAGGSSSSG